MPSPSEVTLELTPSNRVDVIDVNRRIEAASAGFFQRHRKTLYCSYHTTAGYLEQSLCEQLGRQRDSVEGFLKPYRRLFPPEADYRHDRLELRTELSDEQRRTEPRNADSHLTFIGSGLTNCVTYDNHPGAPAYFIDLDGINANDDLARRQRRTTILGFDRAEPVARVQLAVPVSGHPIDSINLKAAPLSLFDQLSDLVARYGIRKGRIDLTLAPGEKHAGLTVNEDETLLMAHDLREVLGNPMHFMAEKGRNMLRDPRAIPAKMKGYAKYDLVQVVNKLIDKTGLSESLIERVIDKFLAMPAERYLRMKRSVSLLVSDRPPALLPHEATIASNGSASNDTLPNGATIISTNGPSCGRIVEGRYQSPILVQWRKADASVRRIDATLLRFE